MTPGSRPASGASRTPTGEFVTESKRLSEQEALDALAALFSKWRHEPHMPDYGLAALALTAVCFPLADGSVPAHPWAVHQRDELARALGRVLVAAGAASPDVPLTGPQLLLLADDYVEHKTGVRP